jgi:hypothetical protein
LAAVSLFLIAVKAFAIGSKLIQSPLIIFVKQLFPKTWEKNTSRHFVSSKSKAFWDQQNSGFAWSLNASSVFPKLWKKPIPYFFCSPLIIFVESDSRGVVFEASPA